tara:strand:+ start:7 stop:1329 length:1323 start_codon:yes stop_codon:yes gene_type:complete
MSNRTISQNEKNLFAGSYEIISLDLFPNQKDSKPIDIRGITNKIVVKESLYNASIGVEIRITDGINLLDNIKIMGNEKIFLGIIQNSGAEEVEKKFIIELHVSSITGFARPKPGLDAYSLICVSKHVYHNQFTILDEHFTGTITNNIKNICSSHLGIKTDHENVSFTTTGLGDINGVYPSLKPIEAIAFQLKAASEYSYFYETIQGLRLKTHQELVKDSPIRPYTTSPYYRQDPMTPENTEEQAEKVLSFSSQLDVSKLRASSKGVYSSRLLYTDISIKDCDYKEYRGFEKDLLNKHGSLSDNIADFSFEDEPESREYMSSINSKAFDKQQNYHQNYQNIPKRESYKNDLEATTVGITVYGNLDQVVGDRIGLLVPPTGLNEPEKDLDDYFTGRYLITDILHVFDQDYTQQLTIRKDSFDRDPDVKRVIIKGGDSEGTTV